MKRIQLGLLAVALFGAVAAFATSSNAGEWYEPDGQTLFSGDPIADCPNEVPVECALFIENGQVTETRYEKMAQ